MQMTVKEEADKKSNNKTGICQKRLGFFSENL